jgi:hypothetical protein
VAHQRADPLEQRNSGYCHYLEILYVDI